MLGERRSGRLVAGGLIVAAAIALGAALLLTRGGGSGVRPPPRAPTGIEPLAFMPAGQQTVLDLDTDVPAIAIVAAELIPRLPGSTLTAEQVRPLVGGRMAVAFGDGRMWLAAVTRAAVPRPSGGAAAGERGGTVVVAPSAAALQASLAGAPAAAPSVRATFDRRFAGLPPASARVAFDAGTLLATRAPQIAATAWGRSLHAGAAVLVFRGSRVVAPFHVTGDPAGLTTGELPVGAGAAVPRMQGSAPVVAAVRSPGQTLAFLRSAGLEPALDTLARAPDFLRPDLSNLGPDATITTADLKRLTVRTTPPDPGDWATKLSRLDALSGLIRFAGIADVRIDRQSDGAYSIEEDGKLVGRAGVYGRVVVFSTDPAADLRAAARAPVTPAPERAAGGLTLRLAPALFGALLPALVRDRVGDVSGWARVELTGVRGELGVAVR